MPGIRALSRSAGVSHVTMLKAVAQLKREGVLQTRPGAGTFVVGSARPVSGAPPARGNPARDGAMQKWELVADQLRRDLTFARIEPALPQVKLLSHRYDVDYRTMRKALRRLLADGYLRMGRRGYATAAAPRTRPNSRLFLIALTEEERPFEQFSARSQELLRNVDAECTERGVVLDFSFGLYQGTDFRLVPSIGDVTARYRNELMGFIFWTQGLMPHQVVAIAAELRSCGLPVAVLMEDDIGEPATSAARSAGRMVVLDVGPRCGLEMGRYMIRMGHTQVAYIDYQEMEGWSQVRLSGIRQAFEEIGMTDRVHRVSVGPRNVLGLRRNDLTAESMTPADLPPALRSAFVRAMARLYHVNLSALEIELRRPGIRRLLQPLLERRDISAWIAANDQVAVECLAFLHRSGVRVPGDISVAGFDDTLEARLRGLTSYSFNPRATAAALVDIALRSPAMIRRTDPGTPFLVAGFVSERRSVGRPDARG